ncbi:tetratricopeptide repeat protein [Labilibaculum sp.]|uniref:tetratricopeptide repeat-containing sensor histidine kinase n=1 Tax=Labilibaculum sp. TaxID=2060723 RepID=UPI003565FCD4
MHFPFKVITLLLILLSNNLFANQSIKNLRAELHTCSDPSKFQLCIDLSKEYQKINSDSSLYFAKEALRISTQKKNNIQIIESLLEVSDSYQDQNQIKKAREILGKAKRIANKINDPLSLCKIHIHFGFYYYITNYLDSSLYHYQKALEISQSLQEESQQISSLIGIGVINWERGELDLALQNYLNAYRISENSKDFSSQITLLINIGNIYADEDQNEKSILYYKQAMELAKNSNRISRLASIYNNIAVVYQDNEDYQKALEYYEKSLNINRKINNEQGIALNLNNIGDTQLLMGNATKAIEHLQEAIAINRKLNLETEIIYNTETLAKIYLRTKKYAKAYSNLKEGIQLSDKLKISGKKCDLLLLLGKYYHQIGNNTKAYSTLIEHNDLIETLHAQSRSEKIAQLQTKFESDKKEKENEILRVKNQFTQKQLEEEQLRTTSLFIFSFLALLVIVLIIILFRSKVKVNTHIKEINEKLEESNRKLQITNATKDKFFSIIAHDLRSPFNAILGLNNLIKDELENSRDLDLIQNYNNMANESAQGLFSLLENLLQWAKSQQGKLEFHPSQFDLYEIIETNLKIFKSKTIDKSVQLNSQVAQNTFVYGDRNMIDSLVRNLISNALKYTLKGGNILISSKLENNQVYLSVKDSGIGISKENQKKLFQLDSNFTTTGTNDENGSGLGLLLCKEFIDKNGGQIWVESEKNKGSKFVFTLPRTKEI